MKRIVCLGGGPAGLYAAILLRKARPSARIEVYERNRPDDTFGWGVVFSDRTMENFRTADPESHRAIISSFHHTPVDGVRSIKRLKTLAKQYEAELFVPHDSGAFTGYKKAPEAYEG